MSRLRCSKRKAPCGRKTNADEVFNRRHDRREALTKKL